MKKKIAYNPSRNLANEFFNEQGSCEGPEGVKWELGFAYFDWDLPIFSLGKWDLGHWDWDSETKNGNGKRIST